MAKHLENQTNIVLIILNTHKKTYSINKGKSSLTSLAACFILGKVCCRTYWGGYGWGLGLNKFQKSVIIYECNVCVSKVKMLRLRYTSINFYKLWNIKLKY